MIYFESPSADDCQQGFGLNIQTYSGQLMAQAAEDVLVQKFGIYPKCTEGLDELVVFSFIRVDRLQDHF